MIDEKILLAMLRGLDFAFDEKEINTEQHQQGYDLVNQIKHGRSDAGAADPKGDYNTGQVVNIGTPLHSPWTEGSEDLGPLMFPEQELDTRDPLTPEQHARLFALWQARSLSDTTVKAVLVPLARYIVEGEFSD